MNIVFVFFSGRVSSTYVVAWCRLTIINYECWM